RNSRTSATASPANCLTFAKSPASNNSGLTIQLPPQATTCGKTRYWPMFLVSIPPVGMNRMSLYGAQIACKNFTPPIGSAGKNFNTSTPFDKAISISVGVQTPGKIVTPFDKQWSTTARFVPGETINSAPALIAVSACSVVSAVPAPRNISGKRERICAMASAAAAVRKVISAQGSPPSSKASASGKACSSFGMLRTGIIPICRARSIIFIFVPMKWVSGDAKQRIRNKRKKRNRRKLLQALGQEPAREDDSAGELRSLNYRFRQKELLDSGAPSFPDRHSHKPV